jgi:4-hydroxybenzoate polyprenyltransferase
VGKAATNAIARSGILMGLAAVSFTGVAAKVVQTSVGAMCLLYAGAIALFCYAVDRVSDLAEKRGRASHLRLIVGTATAVVLFALGRAIGANSLGALGATYALAVALYGYIKRIPYAKGVYVPVLWGGLVLIPGMVPGQPAISSSLVALSVIIVAKVALGVCVSDLKDVTADRARGQVTFATVLPRGELLRRLQLMNVATATLVVLCVLLDWLPTWMLKMEAHGLLVAIALLQLRDAGEEKTFFVSEIVLDGGYATLLPLALIFN